LGPTTSTGLEPPEVPGEFWAEQAMAAALASRDIGRVLRAYRYHPFHGRRPLPQGAMAEWLGTSQSQLSRIENGQHVDRLDLLSHWARTLRVPPRRLWFVASPDEKPAGERASGDLGTRSAGRTDALLATVDTAWATGLPYVAPRGLDATIESFLASPSRAFLMVGPPGCGKTSATYHLARTLSGRVDVQLHSMDTWNTLRSDLAADVLRYASMPAGDDALLELEIESERLAKPTLVVIDGLSDRAQVDDVGRQIDRALRQVDGGLLRYLLVLRTPPDVDLTAYPVLSASLFRTPGSHRVDAHHLDPWTLSVARGVWDRARTGEEPSFSELPPSLQRLAVIPLYMRLLKSAGAHRALGPADVFWLVDACVRSILRTTVADVDQALVSLAIAAWRERADLLPEQARLLRDATPDGGREMVRSDAPEGADLRPGPAVLAHDVVREYLASLHLAYLLVDQGASPQTVAVFNKLAERTLTSGGARGLFEMMVRCLDRTRPELVGYVAASPRAEVATTLPLLADLGSQGARFASDEVWRALARRCDTADGVELARALLASAAVVKALGDNTPAWLAGVLRCFGPPLWGAIASFIDRYLDAHEANAVGAIAAHTTPGAAFCARHFPLFTGSGVFDIAGLASHADWRVRAALANGLGEIELSTDQGEGLASRLAADADYKVRAAMASAIAVAPLSVLRPHLVDMLGDESWHVRGELLRAICSRGSDQGVLVSDVETAVATDPSWRSCPSPVAGAVERLYLLSDTPGVRPWPHAAREGAIFTLLREARTGWAEVPGPALRQLVAEGSTAGRWPVQREATLTTQERAPSETWAKAGRSPNEQYRKLRGERVVQVALDLADLERAVIVAEAAISGGAALIEIGDPLIKAQGLTAVEAVKRCASDAIVVAEMMSADWGRDQVVLAAEAGADVAFLIGPASLASVTAAVEAGRRLGVPVVLDVPPTAQIERWVRDMERAGVDGFAVTTNIDLGVEGHHPFGRAREVRRYSQLPVAVSGGFAPADHEQLTDPDWDILVVGRSVAEAVHPERAARHIVDVAHSTKERFAE
jgi:3-keto-L-gulonate-6-phosphate decarboxylase/transcriptional regulator with XRE-family HTH domain